MTIEIKVPAMGESISEATVGEILKPSGSHVDMDDEILELETDKVNQVIYAPQPGVVTWRVSTGDVVKIDQVIGEIEKGAAAPKEAPVAKPAPAEAKPSPKPAPSKEEKGPRLTREAFLAESAGKPSIEPKIEKKTVASVSGGRAETRRRMPKIRQVIAKRLVEAQHTTAMLTTFNEADMSQVMHLREKYKEIFIKAHGVKLGFMSFFVKSCVLALTEYPGLNSYIDGDDIVHREYYDIGVAVGTDRGLLVPVIRDCDHLTFAGIESAIETYAKRAREGSIALDDIQGGGFTITNGGVYGSLLSTPILNLPQSGILGMHKIVKRPIVVDDQIVIRPMMYLALSYDHRIVDGKEAVSFLVKVKECLEDPARFAIGV